ncbi:MAG: hypothetical protein H6576_08635 [Lewinellaceae bacterium]|nr:hypothetical protein [Saprospiraceae bacterium]MCB9343749.1 hypothetical protein [Lewinellaceae bacterium]
MEVIPTANFQPDISFWGLRIGEPVIAATGLLISVVCFVAWYRLGKIKDKSDSLRLSRIFFLLTGISTIVGAIVGHAFLYCLPFSFKLPGWILGMIAVSAFEQASIVKARPFLGHKKANILGYLNIAELTFTLWFVSSSLWFPAVEIHSAFGLLLIVLPLELYLLVKSKANQSRQILLGVALLVGAVLAHIFKISLGIWFSYFDIAHLFMIGAMWKFMQGSYSASSIPVDAPAV